MKGQGKIRMVLHEFKTGKLHSGSKRGPKVTSREQAVAIALSEARHAGAKIPMAPRDRMARSQRAMRDRSTRGSPPFEMPEFARGFRRVS